MLEGLRLGLTTVSRKIGKRNADLIKKLENCNGEDKLGLEVASPLWAGQQTFTNPKYNPLILQDVRKAHLPKIFQCDQALGRN